MYVLTFSNKLLSYVHYLSAKVRKNENMAKKKLVFYLFCRMKAPLKE